MKCWVTLANMDIAHGVDELDALQGNTHISGHVVGEMVQSGW